MKKKLHYEVLRIIAFICVLFNHTAGYGFDLFTVSESTPVRVLSIFLDNISKTGVPVFLMVSGALLIPKKEGVRNLLVKRVFKMALVLLLVSALYYVRFCIKNPEYGVNLKYFIQVIYVQPFVTPLWFMYIYLAFLLMLPFLRKMALNMTEREWEFLMLLSLVFCFVTPALTSYMGGASYLSIPMMSLGIIYPLAGYYVDSVFDPRKILSRMNKVISIGNRRHVAKACLFALVNSAVCIFLTLHEHLKTGQWTYSYIEGMLFIPAFALFYIIRTVFKDRTPGGAAGRVIAYTGSCIFIIYLCEEALREDLGMIIYRRFANPSNLLILFIPYMLLMFAAGIAAASLVKISGRFMGGIRRKEG